jgi:hypothetical protein
MPKLISIGELIDQSWERYRAAWPMYLGISGWIAVVILLDIIAIAFYPNARTLISGAGLTAPETFGLILYIAATYVVGPLLGFWIFVSLLRATRAQDDGRRLTAARAMREAKSQFLPSFGAAILVGALILLSLVISGGPVAILLALGNWLQWNPLLILGNVLIAVAIIVAFVLAVRWSIEYFFAPYLPVFENKKSLDSMHRSRTLVHGRFWAVFWRLVIPKLVFALFGLIALTVIGYVANVFIMAAAGLNLDVYARLSSISLTVFPLVIAAIMNPLFVIADALLYRSLNNS